MSTEEQSVIDRVRPLIVGKSNQFNNNNTLWLIHNVSRNLILNQGCSEKYNNTENIHVDNNKSVYHGGGGGGGGGGGVVVSVVIVKVFFSSILSNRILVTLINQF